MSSIIKANYISLSKVEVFDYKNQIRDKSNDYSSDEVDVIDVQTIDDDILYDRELEEEVRKRVEKLLGNAKAEAEQIKKNAHEQGRNEGMKDAEKYKQNLASESNSKLKLELDKMNKGNMEYLKKLETKLVEMVINVSKKIVSEALKLDDKLILDVIIAGITKITDVDNLNIKVSSKDFDTVVKNKTDILNYFASDVKINYTKDETMKTGDCIIETPYGIIDCGVDTKLKSILEDIKAVNM